MVEYIKGCYFSKAINWICEICGYDYYDNNQEQEKEIDPCLQFLEEVEPSDKNNCDELLMKLDNKILSEYINEPNKWFYNDGISLKVQREFKVGFSIQNQRITIPIFDELGNLVGVKGRTTIDDYEKRQVPKYLAMHKFPKTRILYGLNESLEHIKKKNSVIVTEGEKGVMQLYSEGIRNCVSTLGHEVSETQAIKLERLGVPILLAFDKGLTQEDYLDQAKKFFLKNRLYCIWDKGNLLKDKESPTDKGKVVFNKLLKTSVIKLK